MMRVCEGFVEDDEEGKGKKLKKNEK